MTMTPTSTAVWPPSASSAAAGGRRSGCGRGFWDEDPILKWHPGCGVGGEEDDEIIRNLDIARGGGSQAVSSSFPLLPTPSEEKSYLN